VVRECEKRRWWRRRRRLRLRLCARVYLQVDVDPIVEQLVDNEQIIVLAPP